MAKRPFYWVDAFSGVALGGNPCAVVLDCDGMDTHTMQAVAQEMNISETAFVMSSQVARARARYFTTEAEIPLAGHPTIATVYALIDAGRIALDGDLTVFDLELNVGPIEIEVLASGGVPGAVIMCQRPPQFLKRYEPGEVVGALGLEVEDLLPDAPVQVVSTGTPQLMVPVRDSDALMKASVNTPAYLALTAEEAFMSTHLFCLQGATSTGETFARHFSHRDGSLEDPFTGSSTGGMGAYLWHHGLIEEPRFVAQQGHWMGRPGEAGVEVVGEPDSIRTVRVAGAARVLVRGELDL